MTCPDAPTFRGHFLLLQTVLMGLVLELALLRQQGTEMKTMQPGGVFFELSFLDMDFHVPVVRTLICLGDEGVEAADGHAFLLAGGVHGSGAQVDILVLNEHQIDGLMGYEELSRRLSTLPSVFADYKSLLD